MGRARFSGISDSVGDGSDQSIGAGSAGRDVSCHNGSPLTTTRRGLKGKVTFSATVFNIHEHSRIKTITRRMCHCHIHGRAFICMCTIRNHQLDSHCGPWVGDAKQRVTSYTPSHGSSSKSSSIIQKNVEVHHCNVSLISSKTCRSIYHGDDPCL